MSSTTGWNGGGLLLPGSASPLPGLLARYLGAVLGDLENSGPGLPPQLRQAHTDAAAALREALRASPSETLACLSVPEVAAPALCAARADAYPGCGPRIETELRRAMPQLLLRLAVGGLLPRGRAVEWPEAPELLCPPLGGALIPPKGAKGLRFSGAGVAALKGGRFRVRKTYLPLDGELVLALEDANPVAATEEHPDKEGSALSLGGQPASAWVRSLRAALKLVAAHAPGLRDEMDLLLRQIVPVGYDSEKHLSASYRLSIGSIYLTLHPDPLTMAEALVHEFQHTKANLASFTDPLLENAFSPLYRSPVRPDPRPLWGILLAVHAFLPVAEFLRRAGKGERVAARLEDLDIKNREGLAMLRKHGRFTPAGKTLMRELEALAKTHRTKSEPGRVSASRAHEA